MWSGIRPPRRPLSPRPSAAVNRTYRLSSGPGPLAPRDPRTRRMASRATSRRTPLAVPRERVDHADPAMPHHAADLVLPQARKPIPVGNARADPFLHGVDRQENLPDAEPEQDEAGDPEHERRPRGDRQDDGDDEAEDGPPRGAARGG